MPQPGAVKVIFTSALNWLRRHGREIAVVDQAEVNDVDGNLRPVARLERLPDFFLQASPCVSGPLSVAGKGDAARNFHRQRGCRPSNSMRNVVPLTMTSSCGVLPVHWVMCALLALLQRRPWCRREPRGSAERHSQDFQFRKLTKCDSINLLQALSPLVMAKLSMAFQSQPRLDTRHKYR